MGRTSTIALILVVTGTTACGESSTDGSGNPGGGSGGVSGAGAAATGGAGAGGASGSTGGSNGGAAGSSSAGHCAPGTLLSDPIDTYSKGNVKVCYGYPQTDGGIPITGTVDVRDIKTPGITGGKPYTISIQVRQADGIVQAELWGASDQCGPAGEELWSGSMPFGVFCVTLNPKNSYSHLLMVWRAGGQHGSITLCPDGQCPQ